MFAEKLKLPEKLQMNEKCLNYVPSSSLKVLNKIGVNDGNDYHYI